MAPDESQCLGCTYIVPSDKAGYDAAAFYWVRTSAAELDGKLGSAFRNWVAEAWPFARVAYPGRDIAWNDWLAKEEKV
jgi:hypothetical protein